MPTFAFPLALLLFLPAPLLLWWWRRRGRLGLRYSQTELLSRLPVGRAAKASRWGFYFRAAGLVLLILALAGPRWPDAASRIPTEGIAIAMVVDTSASMAQRDFLWQNQALTRLEAVQQVFRLLVAGGTSLDEQAFQPRPGDLIGLVTFATRPETVCPLTLDHAALMKILDAQAPKTLATEATTNPGDAIAWALAALHKAPARRKVLIFLTDGESNVPPPALSPRQAAQLAGNLGIPIYAIGAGNEYALADDGTKGDVEKAKAALEDVARISKGMAFPAGDMEALTRAVAEIDRLERSRLVSFEYRRYHETFVWLALLALVCLLTVNALESTLWRRLP